MDYELKKGEYLTIESTPVDQDGEAVDVSSGYTFNVTVKAGLGDTDAEAIVKKDSATDATRFSAAPTTLTTKVLTSAECNALSGYLYFYDIWVVDGSGNESYIGGGEIKILRTPTNTK